MSTKLKDGANKKKHSKLIANKKQKIVDKKLAREQKIKTMYAKVKELKGEVE